MDIKYSVIIPCYNEASRGDFRARVKTIMDYFGKFDDTEVVFVNDGSKDNTLQVLRSMKVRCISHPHNRGKGYTIMHGVRHVRGEHVLYMDGDLSVDLSTFEKFRKVSSPFTICICERTNRLNNRSFIRTLGSMVFQDLLNIFMPIGVNDTQCGFKMFPRDGLLYVLPYCKCTRWFLDIELLYSLKQSGYTIKTFPILWHSDEKSTMNIKLDSLRILIEFIDMLGRREHLRYKR